jgi:hypothetical protein
LAPQQQQPQLPLAEIILAGFEGDLFSSSSNGMTEYFTNLMLYIHAYYYLQWQSRWEGEEGSAGVLRKEARCERARAA